jgi:carboxyl-terminal processing protease
MSRIPKFIVLALSFLVFSYVGLGYVLGQTNSSDQDKTFRSLTVYSEVLQRIQEDYVDEPNLSVVTAGALHGLLESLDPFSGYMSPREYTDYKDKQKSNIKGEVGATLAKRFGYIVVVSVLPGSPAEKAGMRGGDVLESISGFTSREMSVAQANVMLDGSPGSTVKASIVRRGRQEPVMLDLTRAVLQPPHLNVEKMGDVAYLDVPALNAGMASELREKLQQLDKQGVHKLVLDLRDTSSGPVSEGVAAARLFLPKGNITSLSGQTVPRQTFDAEPNKVVWHYPVEVLISERTLGAAEVLAASLGSNQRADLVGSTRTFGGACEQKLIPLEDGSALVLSVAYYYTPAGKSIIDDGVQPTVTVRLPMDYGDVDDDDAAIAPQPRRSAPDKDPVLLKALDLLKDPAVTKAAA